MKMTYEEMKQAAEKVVRVVPPFPERKPMGFRLTHERIDPFPVNGVMRCKVWENHDYAVAVYLPDERKITHLSIQRKDMKPGHSWTVFQRIKNALVGEETEAVEVYPPESLKFDLSNTYHLWALPPGKASDSPRER